MVPSTRDLLGDLARVVLAVDLEVASQQLDDSQISGRLAVGPKRIARSASRAGGTGPE